MIKVIVGNASNGMSFIGCLSAKRYLCQHLPMMDYDAAAKPQGAPGLDIDEQTAGGKRVVGEVKTTMPYKQNDFGAQQISSFRRDFAKLNAAQADYKYLFVTTEQAFDILKRKYAHLIPDVKIVLLNIRRRGIRDEGGRAMTTTAPAKRQIEYPTRDGRPMAFTRPRKAGDDTSGCAE